METKEIYELLDTYTRYILRNYQLCQLWGSIFNSELHPCYIDADKLLDNFLNPKKSDFRPISNDKIDNFIKEIADYAAKNIDTIRVNTLKKYSNYFVLNIKDQ